VYFIAVELPAAGITFWFSRELSEFIDDGFQFGLGKGLLGVKTTGNFPTANRRVRSVAGLIG
jgi:hypothetical protein